VDSGLQVWLEEDGDGSTRQSGVETSGLWPMGATRHKSSKSCQRRVHLINVAQHAATTLEVN